MGLKLEFNYIPESVIVSYTKSGTPSVNQALCSLDCGSAKHGNSKYCVAHKCETRDCDRPKKVNGKYCYTHGCDFCDELALNGESQCSLHKCEASKCRVGKLSTDVYCYIHRCQIQGCQSKGGHCDLCTNHKCSFKGCRKVRSGLWYCLNHCDKRNDYVAMLLLVELGVTGQSVEYLLRGGLREPILMCQRCRKYGAKKFHMFDMVCVECRCEVCHSVLKPLERKFCWDHNSRTKRDCSIHGRHCHGTCESRPPKKNVVTRCSVPRCKRKKAECLDVCGKHAPEEMCRAKHCVLFAEDYPAHRFCRYHWQ